ncbi:hypothetical protein EIK77_007593 [Talaromyces pinophilus]|nr:hypothetical protein EIK77_007593 [Talaromyces pinophilus]
MGGTTTSRDSKGQDKDYDLGAAVQRCGDQVIPLNKQLRMILSNVELEDEGHNEETGKPTVDTNVKVTHEPENNRWVVVSPVLVPGNLIRDISGERHKEAQEKDNSDPLVVRANAEHFWCDTPGDGHGVEGLDVLSGPDTGTLNRFQDGFLR